MRIFSKHKDYYDSVQAYGADPITVYNRKKSIVEKNKTEQILKNPLIKNLIEQLPSISRSRNTDQYPALSDQAVIFFCGKFYLCFVFNYKETKNSYCYNFIQIEDVIRQWGSKKQKEFWFNKKSDTYLWHMPLKDQIPKIFDYMSKNQTNPYLLQLHHELGVPVFSLAFGQHAWEITLNPVLKQYRFYKIFDTYRAYQEISMFISGVLGGQSPPIVEISDQTRIDKHGFDEWSFRKGSSKK